jgi:uncharacterized protein with PQ loop repeat
VSIVDAIGWIAALSSACIALPQGLRILATRSVAGISPLIWQMTLVGAIAWFAHGMIVGRAQIVWPNLMLAITAAWVLGMVCRADRLPLGRSFALPLFCAALAFGIEVALGPVAFGVAMFIPSAVGQVSQLATIRRSVDTTGVSMAGMVVGLVCQMLWWSYALLAGDSAIIVTASPTALFIIASIAALQIKRSRTAALVPAG